MLPDGARLGRGRRPGADEERECEEFAEEHCEDWDALESGEIEREERR